MVFSVEAWVGIFAIIVAIVGILVARSYIARKSHVQKQTTIGGTSIQSGRDTNIEPK